MLQVAFTGFVTKYCNLPAWCRLHRYVILLSVMMHTHETLWCMLCAPHLYTGIKLHRRSMVQPSQLWVKDEARAFPEDLLFSRRCCLKCLVDAIAGCCTEYLNSLLLLYCEAALFRSWCLHDKVLPGREHFHNRRNNCSFVFLLKPWLYWLP